MSYSVNVRLRARGVYEWEVYGPGKALRIASGTLRGSYEKARQEGNAEIMRIIKSQVPPDKK